MDSLPPPPAPPAYVAAAGDIYPRGPRERELCAKASHPDWLYLAGLVVLDAGAVYFDASSIELNTSSVFVRTVVGPGMVGLTWGATLGGGWLALAKCDPHWVGESPPEGRVRAKWPMALTLALLAGVTAPVIHGIAVPGNILPLSWSTTEREMHLVVAGVAGVAGALIPYLVPPKTYRAARELEHIRFEVDHQGAFLGYRATF